VYETLLFSIKVYMRIKIPPKRDRKKGRRREGLPALICMGYFMPYVYKRQLGLVQGYTRGWSLAHISHITLGLCCIPAIYTSIKETVS
jgi:hypothetical protein